MPPVDLLLPLDAESPVCIPGPDGHCSLCTDEAEPGQVLALAAGHMGRVALPAGEQDVALDLVDEVQVGDWVLVHLGFAIARLDGRP